MSDYITEIYWLNLVRVRKRDIRRSNSDCGSEETYIWMGDHSGSEATYVWMGDHVITFHTCLSTQDYVDIDSQGGLTSGRS
jgi:hypothetical protein